MVTKVSLESDLKSDKVSSPPLAVAPLYKAQTAAGEVFNTHFFPCYTTQYVGSQEGFKGKLLWVYSKGYDAAAVVGQGIGAVGSAAAYIGSGLAIAGDYLFGWAVHPVVGAVFPVNPINGQRHFVGIPRSVEKFLGDNIFYPLNTLGLRETNELLPNTQDRIADRVNGVMKRLTEANDQLLNPKKETTRFDYRVKTIHSSDVNAFAVPAGGMVVYTQLVKEIDAAIQSQSIKTSTVQFADGSTAEVDLSGVRMEDALAALMGHEMTHVASRHSMAALAGSLVRTVLLSVGRFFLINYLKHSDKEYMELSKKALQDESDRKRLAQKEKFYASLNEVFAWVEERIKSMASLFSSRKNEYEADVTGAYFASQAQYNPLGALYLQEVLGRSHGGAIDFLQKHFEFLFTHPYKENRKRALFAAISEIAPQALKGHTQWKLADSGYNIGRCSPAIQYASAARSN